MLGFFVAALGVLFGFGHIQVRQFELAAASEIAGKLDGNPVVEVSTKLNGLIAGPLGDVREAKISARDFSTQGLPLFTEPWRSKRGVLRSLKLELANFELGGLRVDSLTAEIPDCRFDYSLALRHRKIRLSRSGVGTGVVRLRDADLSAFILRKFKEIKSVEVVVRDGKAFVSGFGEFVIVKTNFEVVATLESPDGYTLELAHARIFFDGKPADEHARAALLKTLNPVVDLRKDLKLMDAIRIRDIELAHGFIVATGDTRIPINPERR